MQPCSVQKRVLGGSSSGVGSRLMGTEVNLEQGHAQFEFPLHGKWQRMKISTKNARFFYFIYFFKALLSHMTHIHSLSADRCQHLCWPRSKASLKQFRQPWSCPWRSQMWNFWSQFSNEISEINVCFQVCSKSVLDRNYQQKLYPNKLIMQWWFTYSVCPSGTSQIILIKIKSEKELTS